MKLAHAERSMERFWKAYEKGYLDPGIETLRSLGYSAIVVDFILNPDNYFFPKLRLPPSHELPDDIEDKIPVLSVPEGTIYYAPQPYGMHHLQVDALRQLGFSEDDLGTFQSMRDIPVKKLETPTEYVAGVNYIAYAYQLEVSTKPTLVFNSSKIIRPDAVLHEFTHLVQIIDNPICIPTDTVSKELEAYSVQGTPFSREGLAVSAEMRRAQFIDSERRYHLGDNKYTPDQAFFTYILNHLEEHPELNKIIVTSHSELKSEVENE
jgi:hypothetical protein